MDNNSNNNQNPYEGMYFSDNVSQNYDQTGSDPLNSNQMYPGAQNYNHMGSGPLYNNQMYPGAQNYNQTGSGPLNNNQMYPGSQNYNQTGSGPLNNNQMYPGSQNYNQAGSGPLNTNQPYPGPQNYTNPTYNYSVQRPNQTGNSGLGVAALIFSILGCTFFVGAILAIIDLTKNDGKKKTLSKIALGICGAWILLSVITRLLPKSDGSTDVSYNMTTERVTEQKTTEVVKVKDSNSKGITTESVSTEDIKEEKKKSVNADKNVEEKTEAKEEVKKDVVEETKTETNTIHIGDEFGNKTVKGAVIYADLDYKDYNELWTEIPEGKKAVFVKIRVTNISDNPNYVSVGDFGCYADDVSVSAELISGSTDDYNANIESGRSAVLGALYIVPENSKRIELEYNPIGELADRIIIVISDESTTETILEAKEGAGEIDKGVSEDVKVIGIGDEFGNKTIKGVVQSADLDYRGYNEFWTEIPEGKKAIYILIKVTNISEEENYVSVGDFGCYVDDVSVSAELVSGSDDDYNANIGAGRSAVLGAMYVVPVDANSIELEYRPLGESSERVIIKIN